MEPLAELLPGAWLLRLPQSQDLRGRFVKPWSRGLDAAWSRATGAPPFAPRELFLSVSRRHVIRGLHFQCPPHAHAKLVLCAAGAMLDALVDLRPGDGYGRIATASLVAEEGTAVFIPVGVAHGFRALADETVALYATDREYAPDHDAGISWDSVGIDWGIGPGDPAPLVSVRDAGHPPLSAFRTPFAAV